MTTRTVRVRFALDEHGEPFAVWMPPLDAAPPQHPSHVDALVDLEAPSPAIGPRARIAVAVAVNAAGQVREADDASRANTIREIWGACRVTIIEADVPIPEAVSRVEGRTRD